MLATSLLDMQEFGAEEIPKVYSQRWRIEEKIKTLSAASRSAELWMARFQGQHERCDSNVSGRAKWGSEKGPRVDRAPSALWLWGFWIYVGTAVAAFVVSLHAPIPGDRFLRGIAGVFFLVGGPHQVRVVRYKCATRGPYSTYGPDSYPLQRQMGWSAMVLGAVFIASALVEFER